MKIQKAKGDAAENELLEYLHSVGIDAELNLIYSLRYDYDIIARNVNHSTLKDEVLTFECKHDSMASRTGNIAIEYHNSKQDKPSGINTTSANLWAHKVDGQIWLIGTNKLREFIATNTPHKTIIGGGDENANLYLYKTYVFTNTCTKLESIKCWDDLLLLL